MSSASSCIPLNECSEPNLDHFDEVNVHRACPLTAPRLQASFQCEDEPPGLSMSVGLSQCQTEP